jgi:hypothetical protein
MQERSRKIASTRRENASVLMNLAKLWPVYMSADRPRCCSGEREDLHRNIRYKRWLYVSKSTVKIR